MRSRSWTRIPARLWAGPIRSRWRFSFRTASFGARLRSFPVMSGSGSRSCWTSSEPCRVPPPDRDVVVAAAPWVRLSEEWPRSHKDTERFDHGAPRSRAHATRSAPCLGVSVACLSDTCAAAGPAVIATPSRRRPGPPVGKCYRPWSWSMPAATLRETRRTHPRRSRPERPAPAAESRRPASR
jgi:hypothetical protein